jgi:lipopolysaccharide transport system permease protein
VSTPTTSAEPPATAPPSSRAGAAVTLREAHRRPLSASALWEVVTHLARRELDSKHHLTLFGWTWPLVRQLAQLGVLVFIFTKVFTTTIPHFAVFVFIALIAWTWFASAIGDATTSVAGARHLVFQSRVPTAAIPIVAVVVPLVDVLIALPVLLLMLGISDELRWTLLLCPLLIPIQALLMAGVAWLVSAASVFFRDVPNVVFLGLTLLFYMTPVFYETSSIPSKYAWVLKLNPLAVIIEEYRALLLGGPAPSGWLLAYVVLLSAAVAGGGYAFFRRLESRFPDFQ